MRDCTLKKEEKHLLLQFTVLKKYIRILSECFFFGKKKFIFLSVIREIRISLFKQWKENNQNWKPKNAFTVKRYLISKSTLFNTLFDNILLRTFWTRRRQLRRQRNSEIQRFCVISRYQCGELWNYRFRECEEPKVFDVSWLYYLRPRSNFSKIIRDFCQPEYIGAGGEGETRVAEHRKWFADREN